MCQRTGQQRTIGVYSITGGDGAPPIAGAYSHSMHETPDEVTALQHLLDASIAGAGPHLRSIFTDDHRPSAADIVSEMTGMCLLTVATVTADGRPIAGPLDGYLLHGTLWASSSPESVRVRHLRVRPAVSATYLPGENFALSVHGRADVLDLHSAPADELRQAMLDHYVPLQGPAFAEWLESLDGVAIRIDADKMFAFGTDET